MNSTTRVAVGAIGRALKALDEAATMKDSGLSPFGVGCWDLARQLLLAAMADRDYTVDFSSGYRAVTIARHAKAMGFSEDTLRRAADTDQLFHFLLCCFDKPQLRQLIVESARRRLAGE